MKILSVAWAIYDDRIDQFANNCTGGGLVIKNLCEYIGKKQESYLLLGISQMPDMMLGNIHIVGTDYYKYEGQNDLNEIEKRLQKMCFCFEKSVEKIKPDIVNFHGIGMFVIRCINICINKNIPYVFTEHLYIGLNKNYSGYDTSVELEKELYSIKNIKVIAVSNGMKKKILRDFTLIKDEQIKVIVNGTDFCADNTNSSLENKNKKILLCIGSITPRKNQMQIIDCYNLIDKEVRENIQILFCGNDRMNGLLKEAIWDKNIQNNLKYIGSVSSNEMKNYYSAAAGLIMPSKAEGLSIAALEAISYGLPVIMFKDSECAEDLNDEKVSCFVNEHNDECLAQAITKWYNGMWDKSYIQKYSENFTMEKMANDYIKYYEMSLNPK